MEQKFFIPQHHSSKIFSAVGTIFCLIITMVILLYTNEPKDAVLTGVASVLFLLMFLAEGRNKKIKTKNSKD
jgi:hypothetical protein